MHCNRIRMTAVTGTYFAARRFVIARRKCRQLRFAEAAMNGIIYLIGLIVVIMAILSFFGLH